MIPCWCSSICILFGSSPINQTPTVWHKWGQVDDTRPRLVFHISQRMHFVMVLTNSMPRKYLVVSTQWLNIPGMTFSWWHKSSAVSMFYHTYCDKQNMRIYMLLITMEIVPAQTTAIVIKDAINCVLCFVVVCFIMWGVDPYALIIISDVIMGAMAHQITCLTIVYSTVYTGVGQRKHQSSASLASVRGIHRWPVDSPHKWPVTRKMFQFDDFIMIHMPQWGLV